MSKEDQQRTLTLLEEASAGGCARAMVDLARVKIEGAGVLDACKYSRSAWCEAARKEGTGARIASLSAQAYDLLSVSTQDGEGFFELAVLVLDPSFAHFSKEKGQRLMEEARKLGDERAINYLERR